MIVVNYDKGFAKISQRSAFGGGIPHAGRTSHMARAEDGLIVGTVNPGGGRNLY
jgi:hypothetical protein